MNFNPEKFYNLGFVRVLVTYGDIERYRHSDLFHLNLIISVNYFVWVDRELMEHIAWVLSPYLPKKDIEEIADRFGHTRHVCGWSNEDDPDIPF